MAARSRLIQAVIEASVSKNWTEAQREWRHTRTEILEAGEYSHCPCGQRIKILCTIRNENNENELIVGNDCINHFTDNEDLARDAEAALNGLTRGNCERCGNNRPAQTGLRFADSFICCRCRPSIEWGNNSPVNAAVLHLVRGWRGAFLALAANETGTCIDCAIVFRRRAHYEKRCYSCYKTR